MGAIKSPQMGVAPMLQFDLCGLNHLRRRMDSIEKHIRKDRLEVEAARRNGEQAKEAHFNEELAQLETYQKNHPNDHHDPTALELHCDLNPDAPECRVYDD